jgi:hypothetical protein
LWRRAIIVELTGVVTPDACLSSVFSSAVSALLLGQEELGSPLHDVKFWFGCEKSPAGGVGFPQAWDTASGHFMKHDTVSPSCGEVI